MKEEGRMRCRKKNIMGDGEDGKGEQRMRRK
jgi:hypothetical protein